MAFGYTYKVRGAQEDCRRQGIAFLPMAAESFGGWPSLAGQEVKKLGAALACHWTEEGGGSEAPLGQAGDSAPGGECHHPC